jgi:hypothetical protein
MNSITAGALIAAAVAGWPLYSLVSTGDLDITSALLRGGAVAGGCAIGVTMLVRLAVTYEAQSEAAQRQRKLDTLFTDLDDAAATGGLDRSDTGGDPPGGPGTRSEGTGAAKP